MNENRVTAADAPSDARGVAGGSIGLTATQTGGTTGGWAGGCCATTYDGQEHARLKCQARR